MYVEVNLNTIKFDAIRSEELTTTLDIKINKQNYFHLFPFIII